MLRGPQADLSACGLDRHGAVDDLRQALAGALSRHADCDGVLLLTDGTGETATNLAMSLLDQGPFALVSGANLPMLLEVLDRRAETDLAGLARLARDAGRAGVALYL